MPQNLIQATSNLPGLLVTGQLAAAETVQYLVPAQSAVKIASATLCNVSASAVTVSVSLVKAGAGAAGNNTNRVLSSFVLEAKDSLILTELVGAFMGPGDFISAIASTDSAVAFVVTGAVSS